MESVTTAPTEPATPTEPGVYEIPFGVYQTIDAVNISSLKVMDVSPRHFAHDRTVTHDSDAIRLGRAVHTSVLEPDRFPLEHVIWSGKVRRGKDWDRFSAANSGRSILRESDYAKCVKMRDVVRNDAVAGQWFRPSLNSQAEQTLVWQCGGTLCKSRLDWIVYENDCAYLIDLKTTNAIAPCDFGRAAARYHYDAQLAFYVDAIKSLGIAKTVHAKIISVESDAPFDVAVYAIPEHVIESGHKKYRAWLQRLAHCRERDEYPGVANDSEHQLPFPEFALFADSATAQTSDAE